MRPHIRHREIKMGFALPEYFLKHNNFNKVEFKNASYVEYFQQGNSLNNACNLTSNILVIPIQGKKILHTPNGDHEILPGRAFFLKKGHFVTSEFTEGGFYKAIIFFFEDSFLNSFVQDNGLLEQMNFAKQYESGTVEKPFIFHMDVSPFLQAGVESFYPYFIHHYTHDDDLIKLKIYEILLTVINSKEKKNFLEVLTSFIPSSQTNLRFFMEQNFLRPASIGQLAEESGRSLSTFKKEFADEFGEPPKKWITQKRLERAYILLKNTGNSVSEVCYDVGFASLSNFIALFKERYSETPKQFQQKLKQAKIQPLPTV